MDSEFAGDPLSRGSVQFIGTATTLIRYGGFTILTDPNFLHRGEYARLGYGLRSRRLTDPAMPLHALPGLDCVVLSHLHEDHFDRRVQRELDHGVSIVTTPAAASALRRMGFHRATSLPRWHTTTFHKAGVRLDITAMPGRHGPGMVSWLLPPVMGSVLEFRRDGEPPAEPRVRLYITGDTVFYDDVAEIPRRYSHIDQALLHLGGTRIAGITVTMDAKQGADVLELIRPTVAIPIHYNDYTVFKSPLDDFMREVTRRGLDRMVHYLRHGEIWEFEVPIEPGWRSAAVAS
jgi:L-ascorbate metabolism protein UlaG (beta-lactamase superfamily)